MVVSLKNGIKEKDMTLREQIIDELHKPAGKNYPTRKVIAYGIDDVWQADWVEMDSGNLKGISKINKGYKYTITIIDVFSKNARAVPLQNKTGEHVTNAFENILRTNLQTDQGKEFYNKGFKELMNKYSINHYSTYTNIKASVVERFNKTLKEKMWKQFSIQGNFKWIDIVTCLGFTRQE
jgi:hypothetical protein